MPIQNTFVVNQEAKAKRLRPCLTSYRKRRPSLCHFRPVVGWNKKTVYKSRCLIRMETVSIQLSQDAVAASLGG